MGADRQKSLKAFGRTVAARRKAAGLTQEKLGEITGLHRTYIGSVERGERNPTLTTILAISSGLNCNPAELIGAAFA